MFEEYALCLVPGINKKEIGYIFPGWTKLASVGLQESIDLSKARARKPRLKII